MAVAVEMCEVSSEITCFGLGEDEDERAANGHSDQARHVCGGFARRRARRKWRRTTPTPLDVGKIKWQIARKNYICSRHLNVRWRRRAFAQLA